MLLAKFVVRDDWKQFKMPPELQINITLKKFLVQAPKAYCAALYSVREYDVIPNTFAKPLSDEKAFCGAQLQKQRSSSMDFLSR